MIKNEKQYRVSKNKLKELHNKLNELKTNKKRTFSQNMVLASMQNIKEEIEGEIKAYENLKTSQKIQFKETSIEQLPQLLTEYKIANHLSNKEFSEQLNLKEQQLQRYEATGFRGVSFDKLVSFLNKTDLKIKIKVS
ncbi:MAG: hypothetical protein KF781_02845 [Chitinophagaceae bacterium]|nr:hypothetical protein [Chitinophagaceae bacterium]MCW5904448.1 hypothetical protein [Chitinophagaceae bacterium]